MLADNSRYVNKPIPDRLATALRLLNYRQQVQAGGEWECHQGFATDKSVLRAIERASDGSSSADADIAIRHAQKLSRAQAQRLTGRQDDGTRMIRVRKHVCSDRCGANCVRRGRLHVWTGATRVHVEFRNGRDEQGRLLPRVPCRHHGAHPRGDRPKVRVQVESPVPGTYIRKLRRPLVDQRTGEVRVVKKNQVGHWVGRAGFLITNDGRRTADGFARVLGATPGWDPSQFDLQA
ncbi:hypothetical protein ACFOYW_15305 [Gryllotalpicola reticulitermitis]|uniref:Uncharacterized protein n=1 Tax=Gryllotalpicola reticulitermitis TaxID=1184153 RepID=A0ABV8Q8S0_9MICO